MYAGLLNDMSALDSVKLGQTIAEYKIEILGPIEKYLPLRTYIDLAKVRNYSDL